MDLPAASPTPEPKARAKRMTQLVMSKKSELSTSSASIFPDEIVAKMREIDASGRHRILFGHRHSYSPRWDSENDARAEKLAQASGLARACREVAASPARIEELAFLAANYVSAMPKANSKLLLIEHGIDLSASGGSIVAHPRLASDRSSHSQGTDRLKFKPLGGDSEHSSDDAESMHARFASCAIHSAFDPVGGRIRRDGNVQPRSDGPRPGLNISQAVQKWARDMMTPSWNADANEIAKRREAHPDLAEVFDAHQAACALVGARAKQITEARIDQWMEQNGFESAASTARQVWGDKHCLAEIERFGRHAKAVDKIVSERGPLGLFALRASRGLGIDQIEEDLTGAVKERMAQMGLTPGGWRRLGQLDPQASYAMLAKFSLPTFTGRRGGQERDDKPLRQFAQTLNAAAAHNLDIEKVGALCERAASDNSRHADFKIAFSNLFDRELGEQSISTIQQAQAYIQESEAKSVRMPDICKTFLERACFKGVDVAGEELALVHDFLSKSETGVWQSLPAKPSWGQLMRLQKDWHRLVETQDNGHPMDWSSALKSRIDEDSGYGARALETGYDLLTEGKAMHHCVSSYAKDCYEGKSRIFSVTRGESRLGTLELRPAEPGETPGSEQSWTVAQFKGICNDPIKAPDAWAFAESVAQQYSRAHAKELAQKSRDKPAPGGPGASKPRMP